MYLFLYIYVLYVCMRVCGMFLFTYYLIWLIYLFSFPFYNVIISYVESATRRIAQVAKSSKIVVEKSTVPCRTAQSMRTILEANSTSEIQFNILSNPEFLAEGTAISDLLNPDRVLIGALQTKEGIAAQHALVDVYTHWVPKERVITTNLWSSELSKLVSITFILFLCNIKKEDEKVRMKKKRLILIIYILFYFLLGC